MRASLTVFEFDQSHGPGKNQKRDKMRLLVRGNNAALSAGPILVPPSPPYSRTRLNGRTGSAAECASGSFFSKRSAASAFLSPGEARLLLQLLHVKAVLPAIGGSLVFQQAFT